MVDGFIDKANDWLEEELNFTLPFCLCRSGHRNSMCTGCNLPYLQRADNKCYFDSCKDYSVEMEECNGKGKCSFSDFQSQFICGCNGNYNMSTQCRTCVNHFSLSSGCVDCEYGFDNTTNCFQC